MDETVYWLLDNVVTGGCPVFLLFSECVPRHEATRSDTAKALCRLFQNGSIVAQHAGHPGREIPVPTLREIETNLDDIQGPRSLEYRLTSKGGAQWENVSKPDWNRYLRYSVLYDEPCSKGFPSDLGKTTEIIAAAHDLVEAVAYPEIQCADSYQWDVQRPWKATYWKVLPLGHRLLIRRKPRRRSLEEDIKRQSDAPDRTLEEAKQKQRQLLADLSHWYTNPYQDYH